MRSVASVSRWLLPVLTALLLASCGGDSTAASPEAQADAGQRPSTAVSEVPQGMAVATFAGGCFWCMEPPFDELEGVVSTTSGYAGGEVVDPSYEEVSAGRTGHLEVVRVVYDPAVVSYESLLDVFWENVDPLDAGGQFCDRGEQYTTAIFVHGDEQRQAAEGSKQEVAARFEEPIATEVRPAEEFYAAEEYHQDFYDKNPIRYKTYRAGCGRDRRLAELWGE